MCNYCNMRNLLKLTIILSLFCTSVLFAQNNEDRGYIVKVGEDCPNFDLVLPNGETTSIKALRGKVIMLQFTASWCGVCRKEMPFIESDIWIKLKDNPNFAL